MAASKCNKINVYVQRDELSISNMAIVLFVYLCETQVVFVKYLSRLKWKSRTDTLCLYLYGKCTLTIAVNYVEQLWFDKQRVCLVAICSHALL